MPPFYQRSDGSDCLPNELMITEMGKRHVPNEQWPWAPSAFCGLLSDLCFVIDEILSPL